MSTSWIEHNGHLAIQTENGIYNPSFEELSNVFHGNLQDLSQVLIEAGNPVEYIPDLRISVISRALQCELKTADENSICLNLFCQKKDDIFPIEVAEGKIIDHCLNGKTIFNIIGDIESIEDILAKSGIKSTGKISMQQYLKVVEIETFSDKKFFENNVDLSNLKTAISASIDVPPTLNAKLFEYQRVGYSWITQMIQETGGCILGDEMGLGKTMQVIATILELKRMGKLPVLVVAPVSLLANWKRECEKFAPSLNVHIHHGADRIGNYRNLLQFDVVVTAYSTVVNDIFMMKMINWSFVALDEAQNIKNPYSARTKACKSLNRDASIAVSGTPFENHMSDIWSLVDFVQPGLLGSLQSFNENISDDVYGGEKMEPILSPLMIRRLVADVAKDLPDKIVSTQPILMPEDEAQQYAEYLSAINPEAEDGSFDLGCLTKLRMYCTHPALVDESLSVYNPSDISVKYQRFREIMDEIVFKKEKVIVFTSYKKMFDIFVNDVTKQYGIPVNTINGETPVEERQKIVDEFNNTTGSSALFLNPKAAGTGLNITGANHVIHYNLEWNPSLEDQSSARAYRRGQQKTVFIYRLYYEDTVEQVVNERIERKRDTAKVAVVGNSGENSDRQDIIRALQMLPSIRTSKKE